MVDTPARPDDANIGFLKPELVHDGIRGNTLYYDLMARHIVATVAAAARSRSPYTIL